MPGIFLTANIFAHVGSFFVLIFGDFIAFSVVGWYNIWRSKHDNGVLRYTATRRAGSLQTVCLQTGNPVCP